MLYVHICVAEYVQRSVRLTEFWIGSGGVCPLSPSLSCLQILQRVSVCVCVPECVHLSGQALQQALA